ncbi:MAG: type I DNA topoisomerase [Firmicutes bacterium]|nr:type I DNA topoisomerase [Bacillota bacterium]
MKLIIIEGAGKKETIEKYLGSEYKVFATKGHIRDLPVSRLSVDVKNNFTPKYDVLKDKTDIVNAMKTVAKKAEVVYLATDPDREGEAISWHVAHLLGIDEAEPVRIVFNEISKKAVQNALTAPRQIDINLVDAQQARRVLDRLVGYKVSPVLCKKIQNKLSAGRVQSVTLKLVVDREREIRAFKPEEYWPFFSILCKDGDEQRIKTQLVSHLGQKFKLTTAEMVEKAKSELDGKDYKVTKIKKSVTKSRPPAPFVTSTMQQDALNKLGWNLKKTSLIAQNLYEGVEIKGEGKVALVTYIRTDSTRVSPDAQKEAMDYIGQKFGGDYVPEKPNFFASKKGAQDAHEAIRPINIIRTPDALKDSISKDHYALYKLIYSRFLASQMSEAQYNSMSVDIACGDYGFRVSGRTLLFAGFTAVYSAYVEKKDDDEDEDKNILPDMTEGEILKFIEYKYEQKFTRPPARYTEASLVKAMEEKGIGRPATYTPTVALLFSRDYTSKEGRYIAPTELGEKVTDMLVKYFEDIMDITFTAQMEEKLDTIEDGGVVWQSVVGNFYEGFEDKIKNAMGDDYTLKEPDEDTDIKCEECGEMMVKKTGRFGKFVACPGYPKCKNIKNIDANGNIVSKEERVAAQLSDEICEKCGKQYAIKKGRYGNFLGCSGYPECKTIKNLPKTNAPKSSNREDGIDSLNPPPAGNGELVSENGDGENNSTASNIFAEKCEKCGADFAERKGRFGPFLGCTGYPNCKNIKKMPKN